MPQATRSQLLARLRAFCAAHPTWVLLDEPSATLTEVATGKQLRLPLHELVEVVERESPTRAEPFLLVELGDGRELAIADVGIAFAPVQPNTPQAPPLPPVVCLSDLRAVKAQVAHLLEGSAEQGPPREAVDLVVLAIGILDGARHIGFDVSDEEREIDGLLSTIEQLKRG